MSDERMMMRRMMVSMPTDDLRDFRDCCARELDMQTGDVLLVTYLRATRAMLALANAELARRII